MDFSFLMQVQFLWLNLTYALHFDVVASYLHEFLCYIEATEITIIIFFDLFNFSLVRLPESFPLHSFEVLFIRFLFFILDGFIFINFEFVFVDDFE